MVLSTDPLSLPDPRGFLRTRFVARRCGTGLALHVVVGDRLRSGSNNEVHEAAFRGAAPPLAVRRPLSDSDTRKASHATEEARMLLLAARVDAAPRVYDLWYCAKTTPAQRRGLHVVMERFPHDLHSIVFDHDEWMRTHRAAVAAQVEAAARALARAHLFVYDVKTANVVVRKEPLCVRFIDFGKDFCELLPWGAVSGGAAPSADAKRAPVLCALADAARRLNLAGAARYEACIGDAMLVLLGANLHQELLDNRRHRQLGRAAREERHFLSGTLARARRDAPPAHVRAVKVVLRHAEVRDCTEHYVGGRGASVRRLFARAGYRWEATGGVDAQGGDKG